MRKDAHTEADDLADDGYVSKSQKKRDSLALQDIGRKIVSLRPALIRKLPISPEIQEALVAAKAMKMGALKRQTQLIGKMLRHEDDLADLYHALTVYFK